MKTLIAIPVYNEEKYVNKVLSGVRKYAQDILVIDDGSTDDTPNLLARQPVEVIRHAQNRGYGRSMIDAFRWASCQCCGFDWLITMDCDEQHQPASLPDFFRAIQKDDADVISGSRYLLPSPELAKSNGHAPPDRKAINATITSMVNERLGLNLTDAFCGFKAYRVKAIKRLDLNEAGYAFPLQFWVQAAARKLRITEIPVKLIYNDPTRVFGGKLDDPAHRLAHYQEVMERAMAKFPEKYAALSSCGCNGRE